MRTIKRNPLNQYQSAQDPAQFIHHNKSHKSASEAFRDADYATAMWKCETEWDRTKDGLIWVVLWVALIGGLYGLSFIGRW